jgi:glycosyltransferase involved in cell wall biosynthesis
LQEDLSPLLQRPPRALYSAFDRFPSRKGAGVHIARFARTLFDFAGGGLLYALGGDDLPAHQVEDTTEIVRFSARFDNYLDRAEAFSARLGTLLDAEGHQLELAHFRDPWSGLAILSRPRSFGTLFEVNGLPSIELPTAFPSAAPSTLEKIARVEQFVLEQADLIVTPAATIRDHLVSRGIAAEKIEVIPNGADIPPVPLVDERPLADPYILYCGSLHPWQGVETLIRAFALLRDLQPLRLAILCSKESRQTKAYVRLAEKLEIAERVVWQFGLSAEQLAPWLRHAMVSAAPLTECARNVVQGCSPLKVLEAMAAGVPVVASDLPAVRELMTDGVEGMLIQPDRPAALARQFRVLFEYPELRRTLGAAGRRRIEQSLTWEHAAERLLAVYARLAANTETSTANGRVG